MSNLRNVEVTDLEELWQHLPAVIEKLSCIDGYPKVYKIKGAHLLGKKLLVMPQAGIFLKESSFYDIEVPLNAYFAKTNQAQVSSVRLKGEYIALYGWWADEFFHWMLEWLPCVLVGEKSGFKGCYIVPDGPKFILESLELLGIPRERIIVHNNESYSPDFLYVVQSVRACQLNLYPELISSLRESLISSAQEYPGDSYQRIYVARRNPARPRRIVNENILLDILSKYEFTTLILEDLSLAEQIKAFYNCTALVGAHGAGLLHALFMPKGSFILEFFAPLFINPSITAIVEHLNHRYQMLVGYYPGGEYLHGEDIEVYGVMVSNAIKCELGT